MKIAYFDCVAGASGDMILGAIVDAGLALDELRERLSGLAIHSEFEMIAERVDKNGFGATKVHVITPDHAPDPDHPHHSHGRHLSEIEAMLDQSTLPEAIRSRARAVFRRLAEVEAGIHGKPVEQVHLHEVGGVDTIVDVVGALIGLDALGVSECYASPLPLGRGFVKGAHGQIPLPAPATLALLQGVPVRGVEIEKELVTPTGAAILTTICRGFGGIPAMTLSKAGYGAGGRDLPIPNILRLMIGESATGPVETLTLLETNVDDSSPEVIGYLMEKLLAAGALDVYFSPIQMKKNRPAALISVLCRSALTEPMENTLFRETSTLGIRRQTVERRCLERWIENVQTPYGPIRVKVARLPEGDLKRAPEYEDCKKAAETFGVPLRDVYHAVP